MMMKTKTSVRGWAAAVGAALLAGTWAAAEDWPHWRGVRRDGTTAESSRYEEGAWPPGAAAWTAQVGAGSSSMLVVGEALYTMGWAGGRDTVSCLDVATGKVRWSQSYESPEYGRHAIGDKGMYSGPSATPELDRASGMLYTLSVDGLLACWDTAAEGARRWSLNLYEEYGIPQRPQVTKRADSHRDYGYTTAPFVFRDWVLVEAGDPKRGNLFALEKGSGKLAWTSANKDAAGHTGGLSPMVVEGVPCVAVLTATNLCVTRLDGKKAGQTVAQYPWATDFINNIASPAVEGSSVVISSRYNKSATCRLDISLRGGAVKRWETREASSAVCSPIMRGGHVYFASEGLYCLDAASGETKWVQGAFGSAASLILTGDERLIVWANNGDLALVEGAGRSPERYLELSGPQGVLARDAAWPHVVLAGGRILGKDRNGEIHCLVLKAGRGRAR